MSTHHSVLITGGTSGIGFSLARRYHGRGDSVLITGRSEARLREARSLLPGVHTVAGDLSDPDDRTRLAEIVREDFASLDVLINNAGIQRRVGIADDDAAWSERQNEIDVLLAAPIHLTSMLTPVLLYHEQPSRIVNVTSGGAFVPQPFAPTYSAAKAALHSYTMNLRLALSGTNVAVTELIPPAVATGIAGTTHGADVDEFCDAVFAGLESGADEVGFGPTATPEFTQRLSDEHERFFAGAQRFPTAGYRVTA